MDSVKTKSTNYVIIQRKAIAGVVILPEDGKLRIYIAWEWEDQAKEGFFGIIKSSQLNAEITNETLNSIANFGTDVTHDKKIRKHFPHLF